MSDSEFHWSNLSLLNEESEHVDESIAANEDDPKSPSMVGNMSSRIDTTSSERELHESDTRMSLFSAPGKLSGGQSSSLPLVKQRQVPHFSTGFFDEDDNSDFQLSVSRNTSSELMAGQQQQHHRCSFVDDIYKYIYK